MSKSKNLKSDENLDENLQENEINDEVEILDEDEVQKVEEVLEDAKDKEIASLNDKLLRTMAEYDNYRKRTSKQIIEKENDVVAKTVADFLPMIDNLERACANESSDTQYKEGVVMIFNGLKEILTKLGIEEIDTTQGFDPNLHQAVQQVEVEDKKSGDIALVFQKGYKLGEKIIRFAVVAVAK